MTSPLHEILALQQLPIQELKHQYEEIVGKPPTTRSRKAIVTRIANELQRKAREASTTDPIATKPRQWRPTPEPKRRRKPGEPRVGTIIVRKWRGVELKLHVVDGGYELDGVLHKSLSEAARAVTDSHWSGPLFWGLKPRKRKARLK